MTAELDKIITLFENGTLIKIKHMEDIDFVFEKRDSDPFDSNWMSAFNEVESEFKKGAVDKLINEKINRIREMAFKSMFYLTSNGELSGYVSDDFELIAKSIVVGSRNFWLASLFFTYLSNDFPCGKLRIHDVDILRLLNNF